MAHNIYSFQKHSFRAAFLTAVVTEFTQVSALLIDGIIISRELGPKEVAASGLVCPFFFLVSMLGSCFAVGLQTVCTWEMGRGKTERVNELTNGTLLVVFVLSLLGFILISKFATPLAFLFGARGNAADLLDLTVQYLHGLRLEIVPYVLLTVLTPVVILDDGSRTAKISSVVGASADVLFDCLAVAKGGGIYGVGLATSFSVLLSFLVLLSHYLRKDCILHFQLQRVRWKDILDIIRMGLPKAAHQIAGILRPVALNTLVAMAGGSMAVTVLSIRTGVSDFVEIPAVGIAGAVSILTGIAYGELNGREIENCGRLALRYTLIGSSVLTVVLIVCAHPIAVFYLGADSPALSLMKFAIITIGIGSIFTWLIYMLISYLQAVEKIWSAQFIELGANFLSLVICASLLSIPFGIHGFFVAFPVSQALTLLIIWLLAVRKNGVRHVTQRDYLDLDSAFYPTPDNIISYPIQTLEQCALASEQVMLFCKGHRILTGKELYAGLCVEEMTTNILMHGKRHRKSDIVADIRVTISDGGLILRIRDNTNVFNISTMAKLQRETKDQYSHLGIKLIAESAKEIHYYTTLGINTTIIDI